jgi:hypothetical protein
MAELKMDNNDGNTVRPGPFYFFLEPHADGVLRRLNVLAFSVLDRLDQKPPREYLIDLSGYLYGEDAFGRG